MPPDEMDPGWIVALVWIGAAAFVLILYATLVGG